MSDDRSLLLSFLMSKSCPADEAIAKIRTWLAEKDLGCLRHPHGFYVALLAQHAEEEWRFHLWPKGQRQVTGMPAFIHTHDRRVDSRVLAGRLTNKTYNAVDVANGGVPLYRVGYSSDRYLSETRNWLEKLDRRVEMQLCNTVMIGAGMTYSVNRHEFHEVIVPEEIATVTLVRMTAKYAKPVYVGGVEGFPSRMDFTRFALPAKDILRYF